MTVEFAQTRVSGLVAAAAGVTRRPRVDTTATSNTSGERRSRRRLFTGASLAAGCPLGRSFPVWSGGGEEFEGVAVGGSDDAEVGAVQGGDAGCSESFGDGDQAGVGSAEG